MKKLFIVEINETQKREIENQGVTLDIINGERAEIDIDNGQSINSYAADATEKQIIQIIECLRSEKSTLKYSIIETVSNSYNDNGFDSCCLKDYTQNIINKNETFIIE